MSEPLHHVDLCPDCNGLRVAPMTRLDGVTLDLSAGPFSYHGTATVTLSPVPEPCPNLSKQGVPGGR